MILKEFIETERKKTKPKLLWYASGCLLVVIIIIAASFLIPLFSMVSDAKDAVRLNLQLIQEAKFDEAYQMCDEEMFAEMYFRDKIFEAKKYVQTDKPDQKFVTFAKLFLEENYSDIKAKKLHSRLKLYFEFREQKSPEEIENAIYNMFTKFYQKSWGRKKFDEITSEFYKLLKNGCFI